MVRNELAEQLAEKGLRVTPQRITILEAVLNLDNHPTAENVIDYVKKNSPNISVGTVYKVLESFVEYNLLRKVKTEGGSMRFDPILKKHHHLYCSKTDRIEDYEDENLDKMIKDYFHKKGIKNFTMESFNLQITGNFKK